jgi:hypothetical protein
VAPPKVGGNLDTVLGVGISTVIVIALVAYLIGVILFVALLATLRRHRRRLDLHRTATPAETDGGADGETARMLLRGTRSALARLRQRAGGPPSDAVQRAWLALEEAAAEGGTGRTPDQTPTEFTGAVLAAHDVDRTAVDTLRGLYQRARFGTPNAITESDAEAAIEALDRIAATLTAVGAR